jgi:hypothetical protein
LQHLGQPCIAQAGAHLQHGVEIADLHHLGNHPLGATQGVLGLFLQISLAAMGRSRLISSAAVRLAGGSSIAGPDSEQTNARSLGQLEGFPLRSGA